MSRTKVCGSQQASYMQVSRFAINSENYRRTSSITEFKKSGSISKNSNFIKKSSISAISSKPGANNLGQAVTKEVRQPASLQIISTRKKNKTDAAIFNNSDKRFDANFVRSNLKSETKLKDAVVEKKSINANDYKKFTLDGHTQYKNKMFYPAPILPLGQQNLVTELKASEPISHLGKVAAELMSNPIYAQLYVASERQLETVLSAMKQQTDWFLEQAEISGDIYNDALELK
jgi:hypothetical protein